MAYDYIIKRFTVTQADGTKKQIKVYGKDQKEVDKKATRLQLEYEMGLRTLNNNTPFARWVDVWLETYKKSSMLPSTYKDTKSRVEKYFTSQLGAMKVCEIKTAHIQKCINATEGMSTSLQKKLIGDIKSIFQQATNNDMIIKNPTATLVQPNGTEGTRRALTEEELKYFHAVIDKHKYGIMFGFSLGCGLRPGEVRALTWSHIDLKNRTITVSQAVKKGANKIGEPKSKAGRRQVPIPAWLLEKLSSMQRNNLNFIFSTSTGNPITVKMYQNAWASLCRLMDIEAGAKLYRNKIILHSTLINVEAITPYYLRHTYATQLAERGIDIKTAQYLLGHSTIAMTANIYTHVTNRMLDEARIKGDNIGTNTY